MSTTRTFPAPNVDLDRLTDDLHAWLLGQSFNCQVLQTEDGGTLLQAEKQGMWRKFAGMSTALNVVLRKTAAHPFAGGELSVEIGAGKWIDKAAAAVSLFVLWPLAVTAAFGAWEQSNMPGRVFDFISRWVVSNQGGPSRRAQPARGDYAQPVLPPPTDTATTYYLSIGGRTSGPLTVMQIVSGLRGGDIPPTALVCPVGGQAWVSVDQSPDIVRMLPPPPPPPPPPPMPPLPG